MSMSVLIKRIGAVLLFLLLTGCAGRSAVNPADQQNTTQITLVSSKAYGGVLRNLVRSFEDGNPDIRVNYVEMRGDLNKLYDIYTAPLNAEDGTVDVFLLDNVWIPNFGAKNYAEPLEWSSEKRNQYTDSMIRECTYEGKLIAAPFSVDLDWIYYRKDFIQDPPVSWEQWIELGQQLVQSNQVQYGGVIQGKDGEEMMCTAREFIHASADTVQGLNLYKEILKLGGEDVNLDSTTYVKAFSMGEAAFMKAGSTAWETINRDGSAVKMKVGIAPLPAGTDGKPSSLLGGSCLAVNRFSEKKEAALRLVDYLTAEEAQTQAAVGFGIMPTLRAVYDNYRVAEENPHFRFIDTEGYERFEKKGASVSYLERVQKAEQALERFLSDGMDAQTAAVEIDAFLK